MLDRVVEKIKNCHWDWDVKNGQIHSNMFVPACVRPFPNGLKYMLSVEVFVKAFYWLCFFSCELKFIADRALDLWSTPLTIGRCFQNFITKMSIRMSGGNKNNDILFSHFFRNLQSACLKINIKNYYPENHNNNKLLVLVIPCNRIKVYCIKDN